MSHNQIVCGFDYWRAIAERNNILAMNHPNALRAARLISEATGYDCIVIGSRRTWAFSHGIKIAH